MWSMLISSELNFYQIAVAPCGYKSSIPWYSEHQQLSGAPRSNTKHFLFNLHWLLEPYDETLTAWRTRTVRMRRTRYVALPVRAWQYVGLLVVSLACLTLGLVSRDKEGRAGSLAGPELEHRAPHEVDACPNLSPFTKVPFSFDSEQDQTRTLRTSRETRYSRTSLVPANLGTSRSRSADRVFRTRLQSRADFRSADRLARRETNTANDLSGRDLESRLRTRYQERAFRRSFDPVARLSRSPASRNDLSTQRLYKRSTDTERRLESNRRTNEASREREYTARSTERFSRERNEVRRERDDRSLRNADTRNRVQLSVRRDSRSEEDRRSMVRSERREVNNERRQLINRLDRRLDARSNERRDFFLRSLKRSTIDNLERRERTNRFYLVREKRESRLVRETEVPRSNAEQRRIRDLSDDRRSERRSLTDSRRLSERRSASSESRNREEIRADRRLEEQRLDRRLTDERSPRFDRRLPQRTLDRRSMEQRIDRRLTEQRSDRRSMEQRIDRRLSERRLDRRLTEQRSDRRSMEQRIDRRLTEQRSDRRSMEQRFERRLTEQRLDRRLPGQTFDRRLPERRLNRRSTEQRFDRRLPEQSLGRQSMEQTLDRRLEEQRFNRRSTEQRFDRRVTDQRLNHRRSTEQRFDRRLPEQSLGRQSMEQALDRRLEEQRFNRRSTEQRFDRRVTDQRLNHRRSTEQRFDRRFSEQRFDNPSRAQRFDRRLAEQRLNRMSMEQRFDRRNLDSVRLLRQKFDVNRSQRTHSAPPIFANDVRSRQKEQRLADRISTLPTIHRNKATNDIKRSRAVDPEHVHSTDKDSRNSFIRQDVSDDSTTPRKHIRSSRALVQRTGPMIPADIRSLASREKRLSRYTDLVTRAKIFDASNYLKEENSMRYALTIEIIRQALVIGLFTMYGLSIFNGKRSFVSNIARQAPRFIVW